MAKAYGVKKSALHVLLGCTAGLVNNWGYHGRIPYDYLERCCATTGVSMDWLMYGESPVQRLHSDDIDWLVSQHRQVLQDGIEYGLIQVQYQGVLDKMVSKFKKDLWQRGSRVQSGRIRHK